MEKGEIECVMQARVAWTPPGPTAEAADWTPARRFFTEPQCSQQPQWRLSDLNCLCLPWMALASQEHWAFIFDLSSFWSLRENEQVGQKFFQFISKAFIRTLHTFWFYLEFYPHSSFRSKVHLFCTRLREQTGKLPASLLSLPSSSTQKGQCEIVIAFQVLLCRAELKTDFTAYEAVATASKLDSVITIRFNSQRLGMTLLSSLYQTWRLLSFSGCSRPLQLIWFRVFLILAPAPVQTSEVVQCYFSWGGGFISRFPSCFTLEPGSKYLTLGHWIGF